MTETVETQTPARKKPPAFRVLHGITKTISILLGFPLTVLALMSLIGLATDNLWIRLIPALIVAIALPLFVVDRLLPDDDQASARGMPTDLLALFWLGIGVLYIGLGQPVTGGILINEADHFATAGSPDLARMTYWLAGATPIAAIQSTDDSSSGADAGPGEQNTDASSDGGPSPSGNEGDASTSAGDAGAGDDAGESEGDAGRPSTEPEKAKIYTPAELFRKTSPGVVTISVRGKSPYDEGSGTGFFIDNDGTIATNQHVIRNARSVGVKLIGSEYPGGHRWIHEVELLSEDREVDLALLRVPPPPEIEPLHLGDSDAATVGERVICIGNPLGLEHTLSDGLISARRVHRGRRWVQMTAPISPGNSGGPVISMRGEVIAIATATINRVFGAGAQNLNLAVPVNVLKSMIRDDYPERRQFEVGPGGSSTW